jgi:hypothetical protein
MRKIVLLLGLLVSTVLCGCGQSPGVVENKLDRNRRVAAIMDIQERQITDDWDEFWLVDQNNKLMEWHVYLGN